MTSKVFTKRATALGKKQAVWEQDHGITEPVAHPLEPLTGSTTIPTLYEDVTGELFDPLDDAKGEEADAIGIIWLTAYGSQYLTFTNCRHEFKARGLSPTDNTRCSHCGVSIMGGYVLPIED